MLEVVAAQTRPVSFEPEATLAKFEDEVATLVGAFPRADLLVFPELYLTGEDPFAPAAPDGFAMSVAEPIPRPLTQRVGKIATSAGTWIIAGSIFERVDGGVSNTALVFSPDGVLVARHRKLMPWALWEDARPGDALTVVEINDVKIGLVICYEGWFPEVGRGLALAGAEVIVQPSLTATSDRVDELLLARSNALTNQCFVINVNAVTTIGGGRSIAVDPEGRVLSEAGQAEECLVENIDADRVAVVRERGTRGLNRLWAHLHDAPPPVFESYRRFLD
jgi:formamidase